MLAGSVAFVAIGKAIVFEVLGLHRKWWRYFQLPDLWPVVRASAVASMLLVAVFTLAKPYATTCLARSSSSTSCSRSCWWAARASSGARSRSVLTGTRAARRRVAC